MPYENLLVETEDRIATVTVNRPQKLNALNHDTVDEIDACFAALSDDDDVATIIVTGAGDKAFVAGADINQLNGLTAMEGRRWGRHGQAAFNRIENAPKPVIAAINGFALGGGLELAMACHMRIAADTARVGQPEVKLGIVAGYGATQRLPRLVGKGRALEILLTGDPITAAEAHAMGLVNHVVPAADLISKCRELAGRIMVNGPVAVALTLQAVNRGLNMPLTDGLEWEAAQFGLSCGTEDIQEGTRAFLEKRPAKFQGR